MLRNRYSGYKDSLKKLKMKSLSERRENLCLNLAIKCTKNKKMKKMFPLNTRLHKMKTRNPLKYFTQHANTERLKNSSIIYMQNLLNQHDTEKWKFTQKFTCSFLIFCYCIIVFITVFCDQWILMFT